jgi:hypothetical protein
LLIEFLAPATSISPLSGVGPSTISVSIIAQNIKREPRANKKGGDSAWNLRRKSSITARFSPVPAPNPIVPAAKYCANRRY